MSEDAVPLRISFLVSSVLGLPFDAAFPVLLEDKLKLVDDLGADSLDRLDLVAEVEREFDIYFSDEEVEQLLSIGDLIRLTREKVVG